jgi:shikimate kinase
MSNVDHSIALCALGWKPLDIMRKKAKATMMYKTLSGIGPKSLTNLFTNKNEITNYRNKVFQVVFVLHNHAPIA